MKTNVVAPAVGESISEVSILSWRKQSGEAVKNGEVILEIESDKATVEVVAESDGVISILKNEGETVPIGEVLAVVDSEATPSVTSSSPKTASASPSAPAPSSASHSHLSPAVQKAVRENHLNPSEISGTGKDGRITKGDLLSFVSG